MCINMMSCDEECDGVIVYSEERIHVKKKKRKTRKERLRGRVSKINE